MIEFIVPAVFLIFGVACVIRPEPIGLAFCRFGKATWRMSTFGLTDMARFYPEDKAARTFRFLGIGFILLSLPWIFFAYASFSGPGAFAAMHESKAYLKEHHGSAATYELSTQSASTPEGDYFVKYRYGERTGTLRATWKGDRYVFTEEATTNR
jgi:hypothetical protein